MTDTGILFFSRVPRDMRPSEIRDFFSRFGSMFRQKFIVFETNTKKAQMLRKKIGKSKSLQFKEGWLEFTNFLDAKEAAEQMNAQPVNVKNTRRAAGELWACKVLPRGYRWEDLVTEMEGEKRLRRMKIQAELHREKEINEAYRQLAMQEISRRKHQHHDHHNSNDDDSENNNKQQQQQQPERDDNVLQVSDFVKEANSIPAQLMKFKRKKHQELKKATKAKQDAKAKGTAATKGESSHQGLDAVAGKKKNTAVAASSNSQNQNNNNSNNRLAKVYTADGYRDLYNS